VFAKDLLLPVGLCLITFNLGLTLMWVDFRRALLFPKAIIVALICQILVMPAVCFFIAKILVLSPELAVGLLLLAGTPGGASANLFSYLADGDVALNITLTAINSVLSLVTLPLILNGALQYFMGTDEQLRSQAGRVLPALVIIFIPVLLGMWIRHARPKLAGRIEQPGKNICSAILVVMAFVVIYSQWQTLHSYFISIGAAVILFNLVSLATGFVVSRWVRLERRQAIAISMEIGLHNGPVAIGIALSPAALNRPIMAVPATVYGICAFVLAGIFVIGLRYTQHSLTSRRFPQ
jgi:BASS family bile acid:Na+ symporter